MMALPAFCRHEGPGKVSQHTDATWSVRASPPTWAIRADHKPKGAGDVCWQPVWIQNFGRYLMSSTFFILGSFAFALVLLSCSAFPFHECWKWDILAQVLGKSFKLRRSCLGQPELCISMPSSPALLYPDVLLCWCVNLIVIVPEENQISIGSEKCCCIFQVCVLSCQICCPLSSAYTHWQNTWIFCYPYHLIINPFTSGNWAKLRKKRFPYAMIP